jgi:membrane-bound lytic murein transglycosylase F
MESFDYLDLKKFHKRIDTRLPRYEDMIKEAAQIHGFDWRMIAAMVYQESHLIHGSKPHRSEGHHAADKRCGPRYGG